MATHLGLGKIEDEPTLSDIGVRETELVADKRPQRVRFRGVEHGVHAFNHGLFVRWGSAGLSVFVYAAARLPAASNPYSLCGHDTASVSSTPDSKKAGTFFPASMRTIQTRRPSHYGKTKR